MKILILGSSGFLGKYIYKTLKKKYSIYHNGINLKKHNLLDKKNLFRLIYQSKPHLLINLSGITNIDECENKEKLSKRINVHLIQDIFAVKKKLNMKFKLIHFSTDQIYNPKKNIKNKENMNFKSINVYSKHKKEAEKICIRNNSLVFRTNLIGKSLSKKESFTDWIENNLRLKKKIFGFTDSFYSPLSVMTISEIMLKLINSKKYNENGIYNLGSSDGISKYELISKFTKKLKIFDKNLIKKGYINDFCKTPRTKFNRMNINKFEKKFKILMPSIKSEIYKVARYYE